MNAGLPIGAERVFAQINEQILVNASRQFWEQMLSMQVEALPPLEENALAGGHMVGTIALSGVWKGRIEVRMAIGLAYAATAAMMMQGLDSVAEADALDATKEIANMIAGLIKSSLPRPCTMTVPESEVEEEAFCKRSGFEDCMEVFFRHASGEFVVRVCEQECGIEQAVCN
jgi:CheY-specific phosphatase CheX